jgi:signal transduction histidine kinase
MGNVFDFLVGDSCILFFANGLAFFAMGLAIALEAKLTSAVAMSNSLGFLAAFGFAASLGNWIQMFYVGLGHISSLTASPIVQILKLLCFFLAALFLLAFGLRLAIAQGSQYWWLRPGFWVLLLVCLGAFAAVLSGLYAPKGDRAALVEIWLRYLLYAPAMALASLALLAQRREFLEMGLAAPARDAMGAAVAFGLKLAVSGLVAIPILGLVQSSPSGWVMSLLLVRTLTTVAVAYFVVRLLQVFDLERRQQLDLVNQERFQAQEKELAAQEQVCDEIERWSTSMADMVHTVSSAISQPISLEETMRIVLRETINLAGLGSGVVFLLDEEAAVLRLVAHEALPEWVVSHLAEVEVGYGLAGWVTGEGKLAIVNDSAHDPWPCVPRSEEVVRFCVGVPLKARGKVVGVMSVSSPERHELSRQQIALLAAVGQQLGVAIEDARLYSQVRSMAALEERLRLSRELHDNLVQVLGYLHFKSQASRTALASHQTSRAMSELEDVVRVTARAYDDVRDSILGLRVTLLPDEDLKVVLQEYLCEFGERHQIEVALDADAWEQATLSAEAGIQTLRIAQEALTNAWRHGQPHHIWVVLQKLGDRAHIWVRDDGQGFDPSRIERGAHQGLGLQKMKERANSVGGSLQVRSEPGHGTEIHIEVPVNR